MRNLLIVLVVLMAALFSLSGKWQFQNGWDGVDKTVVEKFAKEAGRAPRDPYINTERGDLLLFVFTLAGTIGGFVGGYLFRDIFGRKSVRSADR
jgi:ABC-type cobalt transport system substrate-binding protein